MALFIEVLEGNDVGQRFLLNEGVRLGRSTGEIQIKDAKVSALHAQVEKDGKGQLVLVDRGSANGLRISGQKVQRVAMLPGVKFQVGKTLFKVVMMDGEPVQKPKVDGPKSWKDILVQKVPRMVAQNRTTAQSVLPFSPLIQLRFIEGVQADHEITLGYGPRRVGSDVLDIEIQEPVAPDVAFELHPEEAGVRFSTRYPKVVLLNETSKNSEYVNDGDMIRIGQSLIEIKFLK